MADTHEITETLWKKLAESPFVMVGPADGSAHSEPLTAQLDEDLVDTLFFFVGKDNRLIDGGNVMAQFVSKGHDFFACLSGTIAQDNDRAMIDKLWNSHVEAWFPGGKSDPNLVLLRLSIDGAELWETDISLSGRVKMLFGGKIEASEEGSHAVLNTTAA
jgi:general stress protein 26|uniref:pyridoxamine 5'-phosphate oxidase family protein n=1 Tax=uncultured Sphingomonas sp. TaxID=158754 RepID=UPI0035CADE3E